MTHVTAQMSVSLDGFYAGPKQTDLHAWLNGTEAAGFMRVTRWVIDADAWRERLGYAGGHQNTNSEIMAETFRRRLRHGSTHDGRRQNAMGRYSTFHAPVFVVTHRPRPALERRGGTTFTYVTDGVASAIEQARAAAGGKNVAIPGGGTLLCQVIKLGLLHELALHVVPVILGDGMRLLDTDLDPGAKESIELSPMRVINTPDVRHIRYRVVGRASLAVDYRVTGEPAPASA